MAPREGIEPETSETVKEAPVAAGWTDSPTIASEHINRLVARGPTEGHWLLDLFNQLAIPRLGAGLSFNCGRGDLEFLALQRGLVSRIEGFDRSLEAIEQARQRAARDGFEEAAFHVAGVEEVAPPAAAYDFVLSQFAFHCLHEVEPFFDRLAAALRPGAWMLLNEYVGPPFYQFGERALEIVEEICAVLPARLLVHRQDGRIKRLHVPFPLAHFRAHAPFEGASSQAALRAIQQRFELVERRDYGGSILNPLLEGIVGNFRESEPDDSATLRLLSLIERLLLETGTLSSDFSVLVLRSRS